MQKVLGIFCDITIYVLNLSSLLWYYVQMKHAVRVPVRISKGTWRSFDGRRVRRRGQTLVEYALILAVISIVAIGVLINMGQNIKGVYSTIDSAVEMAHNSH